jgi:hypothetical protein
MFSSTTGLTGVTAHASYASANTFLDAFAQYRRRNGLRAVTLNLGAMDEVGYLAENRKGFDIMQTLSYYKVTENELLDALRVALSRCIEGELELSPRNSMMAPFSNNCQFALGLRMSVPFMDPTNRSPWKRDARMRLYRNLETADTTNTNSASGSSVSTFMASLEEDPNALEKKESIEFIGTEIGNTLFNFLLRPQEDLDITQPIAGMGVDSLVAIELKNWCQRQFGIETSVLEILDSGTLIDLGKTIAAKLRVKFGGGGK